MKVEEIGEKERKGHRDVSKSKETRKGRIDKNGEGGMIIGRRRL